MLRILEVHNIGYVVYGNLKKRHTGSEYYIFNVLDEA